MKKLTTVIMLILSAFLLYAEGSMINKEDAPVQFFLEYEKGTIKILNHTLRVGEADTASTFDFVMEGGQEILYPFERFDLGLVIQDQHRVKFTYQPLEVLTETVFAEDRIIDGVTFSAGTPMEISYGFPFYRISYGYDFFKESNVDLGVGGALQLRNASIVFKELAGQQMTVSQNLGPVPAVYLFGRYNFDNGLFLLSDITGLYASSAIINGADFEFEGSILDASIRAGYRLRNNMDIFINARFFGGSAAGTSGYARDNWTDSSNPTTANYLATTTVTLGLTVR